MAGFQRRRRSSRRALGNFEPLEARRLLAVSPAVTTARDDADRAAGGCPLCGTTGCSQHLGDDGTVMMACHYEPTRDESALNLESGFSVQPMTSTAALAPLDQTFKLHSNPTATKVIYLDFDGHTTSGTNWRNGTTFYNEAYSLDTDFTTFSDAERRAIQNIWARVAEDYIPFNVNVTTEEPSLDDLRKSGTGDTRWGIRVVVGGDWADAAGIAYTNSFNWASDTPAFVFAGKWWKTNQNFVANAISHEAGHTLGLGHDGYNGATYYAGRGTGETSWGPIMGNPSNKSLTQWSKGEYGLSTNKQDDLAIITDGSNGFGYRADDHGDTVQTATVGSTASQLSFSGIIGGNTDVDVFRFTTLTGSIEATIDPSAEGTNLDVLATLLDANGNVLAESNPVDLVAASFSEKRVPGTYFITVRGTGMGDINKTGYTAYGSLGQYTVTVDTGSLPTLSVADVSITEGHSGTASATVRVTLSAAPTQTVTVAYATADDTATTADADYVATAGTLTWLVGDPRVKTFVVTVNRDRKEEENERFLVRLSSPQNATIVRGESTVTIVDDDSPAAMGAIGPLDAVTTTYGSPSETTVMTVSGSNLTADITATAPAGFEVSSDGLTFGPTATFARANNAVDGTLFVRLAATAEVGTYSGNVTLSSTGLPDVIEAMPASTVSPKELTITGLSADRFYDGTLVATFTGTAALVGKVAGDNVALQGTATSGTFNSKDVATASTVTVTGLTLRGTKAANYTLLPTLSASILPKPLTVTANNAVRAYGANNPGFSATIRGFVAGESAATELTGKAAATTAATRTSNAGTYQITPAVGTLASTTGNYSFSFVPGTLTVTKALLSIRIDNKTKVAGQPDPAFTFMTLGLVNGDSAATVITGQPARTGGESVGTTAITRGTLALSAAGAVNYTLPPWFGVVSGTLRIVPSAKPLVVTGAFVKGSNWAQNYLALPVFMTGAQGTQLGFGLGDGANQLGNQSLVSWSTVNQISLRFSEPINTPAADSLSLLAVTGSNTGTQTTITSTGVTLWEGNTVATWTVSNLVTGRYTLVLPAAAITRPDGGQLDGDWQHAVSTFAAGSGNGTAGGDFRYQFQVLVGDVNTSGTVLVTDASAVKRDIDATVTTSNYRSDVNGGGTILAGDASVVTARVGNRLPTGGFAPAVTAAAGATVDAPFALSFADDSAWRAAITGIRVGPTSNTATALDAAAWNTMQAGRITLDPTLAAQLQTSGSVTILISATGYATVSVTQSLGAGVATQLALATQPAGPTANGGVLATQPVVRIQDRYGNTVTTSTQVTAAVESGTGSWSLGGTLQRNAVAGLATFTNLTATGSGGPVSGARIRFTAGALTLVVSNAFTIPS